MQNAGIRKAPFALNKSFGIRDTEYRDECFRLLGISPTFFMGVALTISILIAASSAPAANLLMNPGFEHGESGPSMWEPFTVNPMNFTFGWEDIDPYDGLRCVSITGTGKGPAMWRQNLPVSEGTLYTFSGYVDVPGIPRNEYSKISVAFLDYEGRMIEEIDILRHCGEIDWIYDIPHKMFARAPEGAETAQVRLLLSGVGEARFDNLFFGPTPLGIVQGTVSDGAGPVAGAEIVIWGTELTAETGSGGRYRIEGVPAASPRYVLIAGHPEYRDGIRGNVDVNGTEITTVDFLLRPGENPPDTDLNVRCGRLAWHGRVAPDTVSFDAVVDPDAYPDEVLHYLQPHKYIDSTHPLILEITESVLAGIPIQLRNSTRAVSHAAYEWIVKNVEWDGVHQNGNYIDPTCGAWQTVSGEGWSFGNNFSEWLYLPSEMLEEERGICIEHSKLATALLRALRIPARPVQPYGIQFWVQPKHGEGYWAGMSTSGGRHAYKTTGDLWKAFESTSYSSITGIPADNGPWIHSDWFTGRRCLWREIHPWGERYENSPLGLDLALDHLAEFGETGEAPEAPPVHSECYYGIQYSDFTLDLRNIGDQRTVNARFPLVSENPFVVCLEDLAYWTDHPENVTGTRLDTISHPVSGRENIWFCIDFDVTTMLPAVERDLCRIRANGKDGTLRIETGQRLVVSIGLDPEEFAGRKMECWATVNTSRGWFSFNNSGWSPGIECGYSGIIKPMEMFTIFDDDSLVEGEYTFFFAMDPPDGEHQGTFYDTVKVIVEDRESGAAGFNGSE